MRRTAAAAGADLAHGRAAALRPVPPAASLLRMPLAPPRSRRRRAAGPSPSARRVPYHGPAARRADAARADAAATWRSRLRPVPVRAAGRQAARVRRMLRAARAPTSASRSARASARCWSSSTRPPPEQVEQALAEQQALRSAQARRHPAGAPDRHARAAGRGHRAAGTHADGAHRRGADRRWAASREAQLDEALAQQRSDRSVPLGELLVRKGVVSRADLQTALARKMGYPLVDVRAVPGRAPRRVRALPVRRWRAALPALPLMLRDGRLVVALEDPTRAARRSTRSSSPPSARWCRCWRAPASSAGAIDARLREDRRRRRTPRDERRLRRRIDFEPGDAEQAARDAGAAARAEARRDDDEHADRAERQLAGAPDQLR
ncbi:MAG: hypothetical protein MZW92_59375 [Comamonadaceae bacterium]|nr:hypothetical protein [Comamonadaceae bacterium]